MTKISDPSYVGMLFLLGYGLVYMNIIFVSARRFMRRLQGPNPSPYVFALLVAMPPLIWVNIFDAGLGELDLTFEFTVIAACALGAYFGHRSGQKAQIKFQQNLREYLDQDKEAPEENLNQN